MIHQLSITSGVPIPGVDTSGIPLNPRHEDFKGVRFWFNGPWQAVCNRATVKDANCSILSLFMEDEFGKGISGEIKTALHGDLGAYWNDIRDSGERLPNYSGLGLRRKEDFRMKFESMYPWLRLCEGHWKVNQLWINYFGLWKKRVLTVSNSVPSSSSSSSSNTKNKSAIPNNSKENTPIKVSSDPNDVSTSFKRRHEDNQDTEAGSAKRHKGKGKEVKIFDFHPPRPQPKKTNAKIAKVSIFVLLFCRISAETNI